MYNIEKERKSHPYGAYGKVIEEEHNGVRFLIRSALQYIIDDYDEHIGSVEQSHYEQLNYNEIVDFNVQEPIKTLDLTWMNQEDIFVLRNSFQYQELDTIHVCIDNLGYSYLPFDPDQNNPINVSIDASKSRSSFVQQIKEFRSFATNNHSAINSITFQGFKPLVEKVLIIYAKKYGIMVNNNEISDSVSRHK